MRHDLIKITADKLNSRINILKPDFDTSLDFPEGQIDVKGYIDLNWKYIDVTISSVQVSFNDESEYEFTHEEISELERIINND